ncbi:hypothetical protein [Agrococcus sp. SGAir0287]|uniref:hypothetical protein n=1 Tax=Agrococcus sp. SGAir0287 TaxID=2070347 RepID=UPI0010CD3F73|nr:hypothetical protein [Agrococcus sp. SGAir0287]QCR18503.1 hypothetical protein C1N71_02750 [Agrococcus sp. SGAir0287]
MSLSIWVGDTALGDEGFRVAVGDRLDWIVVDDELETTRRWAGGRAIDHVMDPFELAGAPRIVRRVRGVVEGVESMRLDVDRRGEAIDGSQRFEAIRSTGERSWGMCEAHRVAGFVVVADASVEDAGEAARRWSPWFDGSEPPEQDWASDPPGPDWSAIPTPVLPLPDGRTTAVYVSYDEPAHPELWCRHPAHRRRR